VHAKYEEYIGRRVILERVGGKARICVDEFFVC
jgi:hypothetical protein